MLIMIFNFPFPKNITQIAFPRITICQGDDGWSQENLAKIGYEDIKSFLIGNNSVETGWMAGQDSVRELFDKVYSKPKIEKGFAFYFHETCEKTLELTEKLQQFQS